jgi:hypothetical protein
MAALHDRQGLIESRLGLIALLGGEVSQWRTWARSVSMRSCSAWSTSSSHAILTVDQLPGVHVPDGRDPVSPPISEPSIKTHLDLPAG